jgi:hypothetical protein
LLNSIKSEVIKKQKVINVDINYYSAELQNKTGTMLNEFELFETKRHRPRVLPVYRPRIFLKVFGARKKLTPY